MPYIILLIAVLLIFFNVRAMKKEKMSFLNNFENASMNMNEYDIKLGELRREFSETILELQKEIQDLKLKLENSSVNDTEKLKLHEDFEIKGVSGERKNLNTDINDISTDKHRDKIENLDYNNIKEEKNSQNIDIKVESNNIKINEIETLINKGLSMDEISEKLGIGKGEVLLIKELYLK
ncbi:hypothetical protein [Clostridium omnivorum]|uniref:DNA-binding protein n=1 Tax=Clostridium omnivorum TaxID=1604902 RepID=A0ABQ5NAT0_9CLOT|nr:hypothetical protein [Clostridium sp. E14]GLC32369.1 hypothetical protein bsdE14_37790 [Clostridium sp. E14]